MQQNIRNYKQQERLAKRQEDKQQELSSISELFRQSEKNRDMYEGHRYLVAQAKKEIADSIVITHLHCKSLIEALRITAPSYWSLSVQ